MTTARKSTTNTQSTSKFQRWWRRAMSYSMENTFQFPRWPSSCDARENAPRLQLQKPSAFYWIDIRSTPLRFAQDRLLIMGVDKIALRSLLVSRSRARLSLQSPTHSVYFRLLICNRTPGQQKL